MNWEDFELARLEEHLRDSLDPFEADQMIRAFEEVVRVAQLDAELLPHLLAATVCLLAHQEGVSPRSILEGYFRRSVSDERWRERYLPLFDS